MPLYQRVEERRGQDLGQFLRFTTWVPMGKEVRPKVARKALDARKGRGRQITRRSRGRSLAQTAADLRACLVGWKGYFRLATTPKVFRALDAWIRHRLRALLSRAGVSDRPVGRPNSSPLGSPKLIAWAA